MVKKSAKRKEGWIKQPKPFNQNERPSVGSKQIVGPFLTDPSTGKTYFGVYIKDFNTNSIKWIYRPKIKREEGAAPKISKQGGMRITPKMPRLRR